VKKKTGKIYEEKSYSYKIKRKEKKDTKSFILEKGKSILLYYD